MGCVSRLNFTMMETKTMDENKKMEPIRNLIYLADRGGTGWWRHIQAVDVFNSIQRQTGILNTYTE